jgi:hypothetical protein
MQASIRSLPRMNLIPKRAFHVRFFHPLLVVVVVLL